MVGSAILRAHGDARRSMLATIAGGVVNAVLDPILIFGFGLELTGAALASVAARAAIAVAALYPIFRWHGGLERPLRDEYRLDFSPIMTIALPAILTQFATPLGPGLVTRCDGAVRRRRGGRHGDDGAAGAGGLRGDLRALGRHRPDHRAELRRPAARPGGRRAARRAAVHRRGRRRCQRRCCSPSARRLPICSAPPGWRAS